MIPNLAETCHEERSRCLSLDGILRLTSTFGGSEIHKRFFVTSAKFRLTLFRIQ